jgi:hypothetical protein
MFLPITCRKKDGKEETVPLREAIPEKSSTFVYLKNYK